MARVVETRVEPRDNDWQDMTIDPRAFRDTMGRLPTGVSVITTADESEALYGVTIGSFTSLSLEPPLVLFCLDNSALCQPAFLNCRYFAVNVLAEDQHDLSSIFASREEDRPWAELSFDRGQQTRAPLLRDCVAHLECEKTAVHPGGDHVIIVGHVVGHGQMADGRPLIYFGGGYRRLDAMEV